jgi:hypothetical protein
MASGHLFLPIRFDQQGQKRKRSGINSNIGFAKVNKANAANLLQSRG